jgi:hypothetical protein
MIVMGLIALGIVVLVVLAQDCSRAGKQVRKWPYFGRKRRIAAPDSVVYCLQA